jgi:hypothetical protein
MQFRSRTLVRGILLIAPLALSLGCTGGHSSGPGEAAQVIPESAPAGNQAPAITGESAEVARVGQDFEYQPKVTDPDGDRLQYSAINLPPWARLDSDTGKISGRPATTHVGSYESIAITASDGKHRVTSREFSITVFGSSTGVARLEWPMPVSKVDGSLLDDLAGFRILYGRNADDLDRSVWIADPRAHSFEFTTLDEGAWYFSIVAVNSGGLEGPATTPARKII